MDALVLTCGGNIKPLIKAIIKFQPDLTYFLHSEDSINNVNLIQAVFNFHLNCKCKLVKEYQDIDSVFVTSKEIISELQDKSYDIRIDFTGGTKPMSSGLVLASIGQKCRYSYIGTDDIGGRDKDGVGNVMDGFELVIEQNDPYESYAIFEFERGKVFFDKYQFQAARLNFDDAKEKSKSERLKKLAEIYVKIVDLYDIWDKFDIVINNNYMLFYQLKKFILNDINQDEHIKNHFLKNHPLFICQMEKNIEFLEKKISHQKRVSIDNINYYLPDLLNNAQRRIDEGKYDDAVARLYRAIELIAQIKLTREGFINEQNLSDNRNFKIKKSEIESLSDDLPIKNKILNCYEFNKEPKKKSFGVTLWKSYKLLEGLGFDFAHDYVKDKNIRNNINLRNNSILAHGLIPIMEDDAKELFIQVLNYAEFICPKIEKCIEFSKFPKFNEE